MNKNCLHRIVALLVFCCVMAGCGKETFEPATTTQNTTIYGTVFNKVTHEPVIGAQVVIGAQQLLYGTAYCNDISSSVSGSDGQFELQFGPVDNVMFFYIKASSDGYDSYAKNTTFGEVGGSYHFDINLVPK